MRVMPTMSRLILAAELAVSSEVSIPHASIVSSHTRLNRSLGVIFAMSSSVYRDAVIGEFGLAA